MGNVTGQLEVSLTAGTVGTGGHEGSGVWGYEGPPEALTGDLQSSVEARAMRKSGRVPLLEYLGPY